jgi:hypothetical protein
MRRHNDVSVLHPALLHAPEAERELNKCSITNAGKLFAGIFRFFHKNIAKSINTPYIFYNFAAECNNTASKEDIYVTPNAFQLTECNQTKRI